MNKNEKKKKKRTPKTKQPAQICTDFSIPDSKTDTSIVLIPSILVTNGPQEEDNIGRVPAETHRFGANHGHENLAILSFSQNVESRVVEGTLLHGITINGESYCFLGCSQGGIKRRRCYMWKGTPAEVREILQQDGDFELIKIPSKLVSRFSLLLSEVSLTSIRVSEENTIRAEDFCSDGKNFSDGCGGIGLSLAEQVYAEVKSRTDEEDYLPSVFQVRIQGCKGVLQLDKTIEPTKILIRPSMEKFKTDKYPYIGVCAYSRPYKFGYLNKQFIMVLSCLGVNDTILQTKQIHYFALLETMFTNSDSAVALLQWEGQFALVQMIVKAGGLGNLKTQQKSAVLEQLKAIKKNLLEENKLVKLRIHIPQSRNIYGICDPTGTLKYGECFLRITDSGKPKTVKGQVAVSKNPCYFPGDFRVLTACDETDEPGLSQLNHLIDCIVFPNHGKQPHTHEIGGSDLDGDEYFVTWDKDLIPREMREPYSFPEYQGTPVDRQDPVSVEEMIAYVSKQNNGILGDIDTHFNRWADLKGIDCEECQELAKLFSQAIDSGKSGEDITDIPTRLIRKKKTVKEKEMSRFVWSKMTSKGSEFHKVFKKMEGADGGSPSGITEDMVRKILQQKETNFTPFQKFRFVLAYTRHFWENDESVKQYIMENYVDHIDFSMFSWEQKRDAMDVGFPQDIVMNELNRSAILSKDELRFFRMDEPAGSWSLLLAKDQSDLLWSDLVKALTKNDNILLVLELFDDIILVLQFQERQSLGEDQPVNGDTISSLFYSRQFGHNLRYNLNSNYFLDFTDPTPKTGKGKAKNTPRMQLYRNRNKNLTFVWLGVPAKRGREDAGAISISVNLQRFDRNILSGDRPHQTITKEPLVRIEVYARNQGGTAPYNDTIEAPKMDIASGHSGASG